MGRYATMVTIVVFIVLLTIATVLLSFVFEFRSPFEIKEAYDTYARSVDSVEGRKREIDSLSSVVAQMSELNIQLQSLKTRSVGSMKVSDVVGFIGSCINDSGEGAEIFEMSFGFDRNEVDSTSLEDAMASEYVDPYAEYDEFGNPIEAVMPEEVSTFDDISNLVFESTQDDGYYLVRCNVRFSGDAIVTEFLALMQRVPFKYRYFNFSVNEEGTVYSFIIDLR
jgi:hypothetical protein